MACVYIPKILRNMNEICAEMGVGRETVRRWRDMGAPIVCESEGGKTRYSCEAASLMRWRLEKEDGEKSNERDF